MTTDVLHPEYLGKEVDTVDNDYLDCTPDERHAYLCRDKMLRAIRTANRSYMDIATGLYEAFVNQDKYCKVWNLNFVDFAQQQLGIEQTHAYLLKDIGAFVADPRNGIDIEDANVIGWTKMNVIVSGAKKLKSSNPNRYTELPVSDLIESAKTSKVRDLQDQVKSILIRAKGIDEFPTTEEDSETKSTEKPDMKFTEAKDATVASLKLALVYEADQARFVNEAMQHAKTELGLSDSDTRGSAKAIEHICTSWLELKGLSPQSLTVNDWIKFIESKYPVKLAQVTDADSVENVLGGHEAMQEVEDSMDLNSLVESDPAMASLVGVSKLH